MHLRKIGIMAAICAAASIAFMAWDREPAYQGKSLTKWLLTLNESYSTASEPDRDAATHAIRAMGTNCLPHLVKWARTKPSRFKHDTDDVLEKAPGFITQRRVVQDYLSQPDRAWLRFQSASSAFYVLGATAVPAIPALSNAMAGDDDLVTQNAASCLAGIGEPSGQTLMTFAADPKFSGRRYAIYYLPMVAGEDAEDREKAIRITLDFATAKGQPGFEVINALRGLGGKSPECLAVLEKAAGSSDSSTQRRAVRALESLGTNAVSSLPILRALQTNNAPALRGSLERAIKSVQGLQ